MRVQDYGCVIVLALVVAACDMAPRTGDSAADRDPAATTTAPVRQSDPLITAQIQSRYFTSSEIKGHRIDVDTRDGIVTLEGTVDSDAQRQMAEQIARGVDGVSRVENQLLVRPSGDAATTAQARRDDAGAGAAERTPGWITTKIQSQYYLNPELKPWRIEVETSRSGVVTLSGFIDSEADRAEAVRIARGTEGVSNVTDNLRVQPQEVATTGAATSTAGAKGEAREVRDEARGAARSAGGAIEDGWITMKIQSKYFLDDDVRARSIDVDTRDGVVTLKGSVESQGERQQALSIARSTEGVTTVQDNLVVQPAAGTRSAGGERSAGAAVDDAWITMKVQSKFFIHDEIKSRRVDVDTRNGVVTLAGAVPSETAKQAAEVIAQDTDGVTKVVNNLRVEPGNQ